MTKKEAIAWFNQSIRPCIASRDKPALREAWGVLIDTLCKNGQITPKQYETWDYDPCEKRKR